MGMGQRRSRWAPTDAQRTILENSYKLSEFPDLEARNFLAQQLGIEARQVQVWFQNRRQKARTKSNSAQKRSKPGSPPTLSAPDSPPAEQEAAQTIFEYAASQSAAPDALLNAACSHAAATPVDMQLSCTPPISPSFFTKSLPPSMALEMAPQQFDAATIDRALHLALAQTRQRMYPSPMLKAAAADYFSLEQHLGERLSSRVAHLFSPLSAVSRPSHFAKPAPFIEKPRFRRSAPVAGLPLNRRSVSMEALEVLASCMTE